ncbi:hypothetical protein [Undibacterium sp. Ren11W]|uniref:hypothetical protein n=1 Tax=Undibacterium sp. Ren11W TaxID=3413045 RepID=UPI003BF3BFE2
MNKLDWQLRSLKELSTVLNDATVLHSQAIGASVLYQIMHRGVEKLAISLSDGQALIIETRQPSHPERRRPPASKESA